METPIQSILYKTDNGLVGRIDYALLSDDSLDYLVYTSVPVKAGFQALHYNEHEDQAVLVIERVEECKFRNHIILEVLTCLGYPDMIVTESSTIVQLKIDWMPRYNHIPEYGRTLHRTLVHSKFLRNLFHEHIKGNLSAVLTRKPKYISQKDMCPPPRQRLDRAEHICTALTGIPPEMRSNALAIG